MSCGLSSRLPVNYMLSLRNMNNINDEDFYIIFLSLFCLSLSGNDIRYTVNHNTGAINRISIAGDTRNMNWMLETDGSQYRWVDDKYGWGLGYLTVASAQDP